MGMIAIGVAGVVGSLGALVCVLAWHRGTRVAPALAVATVALPALVGLLAAEMALSSATGAAQAPALAVIAPHIAAALVSRELAFFAALLPALCLTLGCCVAALRAGETRVTPWMLSTLASLPVVALPVVHGLLHDVIGFGLLRSAGYLVLAVTGAAAMSTRSEARVAVPIAFALVVAVGEAAGLAVSSMELLREISQLGAVSREGLDLAVQEITGGLFWLTLAAGWAGVAAIVAVALRAGTGPERTRALVALLWLAPVPLVFLAGNVTRIFLTVV